MHRCAGGRVRDLGAGAGAQELAALVRGHRVPGRHVARALLGLGAVRTARTEWADSESATFWELGLRICHGMCRESPHNYGTPQAADSATRSATMPCCRPTSQPTMVLNLWREGSYVPVSNSSRPAHAADDRGDLREGEPALLLQGPARPGRAEPRGPQDNPPPSSVFSESMAPQSRRTRALSVDASHIARYLTLSVKRESR